MKTVFKQGAAIALSMFLAGTALAAPLKLEPANPQPSSVKKGLKVWYAFPDDVKSLADARRALTEGAKPGRALEGMDYWDTEEGMETLTSGQPFKVAARIEGYVRFDAPGLYTIDFLTNDGLEAFIGGQPVGYVDARRGCDPIKATEVEVPSAGWYPIKATYFQRLGSSCLHMRAGPSGSEPDWMPNSAFGY